MVSVLTTIKRKGGSEEGSWMDGSGIHKVVSPCVEGLGREFGTWAMGGL